MNGIAAWLLITIRAVGPAPSAARALSTSDCHAGPLAGVAFLTIRRMAATPTTSRPNIQSIPAVQARRSRVAGSATGDWGLGTGDSATTACRWSLVLVAGRGCVTAGEGGEAMVATSADLCVAATC